MESLIFFLPLLQLTIHLLHLRDTFLAQFSGQLSAQLGLHY